MMNTTEAAAALRDHADRIQGRYPVVAARARAAADRADAIAAAVEHLSHTGSVRLSSQEEATQVAEAWNARDERLATAFPLAGGWVVRANGVRREVTAEEAARIACWLGYGPPVCTCGRTDGKHGLLCAIR